MKINNRKRAGMAVAHEHNGDGGAAVGPTHGSRYEHDAMSVIRPALSSGLFQPFPRLTFVAVAALEIAESAVSVGTEPVGVYDGRSVTAPPLLMVAGGQAMSPVAAVIVPAPAPPVCQAARLPWKGAVFPHTPTASRGSSGIHPFASPREYDHAGLRTVPHSVDSPIFQVQKNQF